MGEEDQKRPENLPKEEKIQMGEGTKKERKEEGGLDEDLAKTKSKVKEKAGPLKNKSEGLRLSWVSLMKKMLNDLEMKAPDEDPKQEMTVLEEHLVEVKKRATIWQGLAKERMTIMDRGNVHRVREEKRNIKKKNKGKSLRRGLQKVIGVANKTNDDSKKKNQNRIFPLQSFTKVPSASKFSKKDKRRSFYEHEHSKF